MDPEESIIAAARRQSKDMGSMITHAQGRVFIHPPKDIKMNWDI